MPKTSQGDFLNACDKLLAAATASAGQPVVDELRLQLEKDTSGAREAQGRRNLHKGQAQQASRDLDEYLDSAKDVYSRLRHLLIGVFGKSAERLVEFGFQPFRPPEIPVEQRVKRFLEKEKPPETGPNPNQTAAPKTDGTT